MKSGSIKKSKVVTIVAEIEAYIRKEKIQGLKKFRGRVDIDMDLNKLRKRARVFHTL